MTNRQKTVLKRWVWSSFVLSYLVFWFIESFPSFLGSTFSNQVWLNMKIGFGQELITLVVTHQFIDSLMLAFIALVIGRAFFISTKFGKWLVILFLLPFSLWAARGFLYYLDGSYFSLWALNTLSLYGGITIHVLVVIFSAVVTLWLLVLGLVRFFEKDRQNSSS